MVGFSTGGKNVSEVQRQWLLDYKKLDAAMAWNSGMAANCTPTYGLLGRVESVGLAESMAVFSAAAKRAAF